MFSDPFKNSNPKTGKLTLDFPAGVEITIEKAREILQSRSARDIGAGLSIIEAMVRGENVSRSVETGDAAVDPKSRLTGLDLIAAELAESKPDTPAERLQVALQHVSDSAMAGYSRAELFAILALALIWDTEESFLQDPDELVMPKVIAGIVGEAAEAITLATLDRKIADARSAQSRTALAARSQDLTYWRPRYAEWYETEYLPNLDGAPEHRTAASEQFYEEVLVPAAKAEACKPEPHPMAKILKRSRQNVQRQLREYLVDVRGRMT